MKSLELRHANEDGVEREIQQNFPVDVAFWSHWTYIADETK